MVALASLGVMPKRARKLRSNWLLLEKPKLQAISEMDRELALASVSSR